VQKLIRRGNPCIELSNQVTNNPVNKALLTSYVLTKAAFNQAGLKKYLSLLMFGKVTSRNRF
jgi:hypothetical protein